ncbi:PEPxxWA-CTERM sorting domain-containing protein [Sphingomonas abaci]|uniref:Ice-binding protein C-terminal domain-containing protein n=1 Tax=Sphingomonas abaci TaxID=237611 RepID=A0A7W7AN22_9SPHN|nr:PEPxxWA-CTERM sorting domain-containing protein [Sphingomonas abaci]MBB4619916.1 hypothetical protein [Sphingomonas abaci]
MKKTIAAAAFAFALFSAGSAQAEITVYTSQSDFAAAVSRIGTDTFDGFNITGTTPSPINRMAGDYSYTASVADTFFGAGSESDQWLSTNFSDDIITFSNFSNSVSAVGGFFFTSDLSGAFAPGSVVLTATDSLGATVTRTIEMSATSSFLGFSTDGLIGSITLASVLSNGPIFPTANNLMLGQVAAVPEPATWAMMLLGFGMVAVASRYRRRSSKVSFS